MKKLFVLATVITALLVTSCGADKDANGWYTDFDSAKKAAQSKNKNVLLFVNSDMDPENSSKGVEAVLSKEFVDSVKDRYVCIHFDFTGLQSIMADSNAEISNSEQKALEKRRALLKKQFLIADQYGIQTTPIFNILTKEGYYVTEPACEFSSNSVSGYVGSIAVEDTFVQEYNNRVAATKKGSALEKVNAIDSLYKEAAETHRIAMYDLVKKVISLDSKNKSGLLGEYVFQLANLEGYKNVIAEEDMAALKVYLKYADHPALAPVDSQSLYYMAARISSRIPQTKPEDIIANLDKAIAAASESEYVGYIQQIRESIAQEMERQAAAEDSGTAENAEVSE